MPIGFSAAKLILMRAITNGRKITDQTLGLVCAALVRQRPRARPCGVHHSPVHHLNKKAVPTYRRHGL